MMGKNKSSVKKVGTVVEKISTVTEEIVKNKDNISNLTNDHFKLVIGTVGAIGEAAMPYLPLISSVLTLTAKIVKAYDNAQYNKKSCAALIQRVQSAEVAVKVLDRRKQENQKNFHQQTYYINFERFITILGDIEAFMTDFTRLSQYKKFISNHVIKERFIGLINDFDRVVHDLGFTMIIASDEDRKKEIEILNKDISEMSKFLQTIEAGVTTIDKKISHVLEHVLILQDKKKDKDFSPPIKKIPPNEIKIESSTHDKKLLKARYLGCNVACDTIILPDDDKPGSHRINAQLAILRNLAKNYEPKITNFSYSRDLKDNTIKIENQKKIIRWLAPEKMQPSKYAPYTIQCEIFSFGMLLWELAFQQLPYKNMEFSQIQSHVLSGKREHLDFTLDLPETEFGKIVNSAWQHDPTLRPELNYLFNDLEKICTKFANVSGISSSMVLAKNINVLNNNKYNSNDNGISTSVITTNTATASATLNGFATTSTPNSDNISPILRLEDGLALDKQGQKEKAYWKN
nr:5624_t:CDS:2 [Entrophospora candida]